MADADRAKSVFLRAAEVASAEERRAYLDAACGEDADLRREVEELLGHHAQLGAFLEAPAAAQPGTSAFDSNGSPAGGGPTAADGPGTVLGPYKLLEQIGEGGMGTVWMAEQHEPIRRRVALKVIKDGMDSRNVLARFEAERQALALMDHPNIAKVLDAGRTPAGRPYFVMELVKGQPITRYCDDKRLGVRERLGLFADVCRAVQHAHHKGIIHRDLKPSNVLVAPFDGRPVVKVIDFGVAKATGQCLTEQTLFTGFGALVGTPEYMSPEQAEVNNQDIDTRSDIYSLGVLLYELLTGSTPLTRKRIKEAALLEVLRVIREEEPPRPSNRLSESKDSLPSISAQRQTEPAKLARLVRGELDWIAMKALEKDRGRRYETANGLAMDLQRYLADEPVQACPPSAWYRLRKVARRNKVLFTAALVVVATLLVAGATVTWKWWDAEQARGQEEQAKGQAEAARDEAQKAEKRAKQGEERAVAAQRQARLGEAEALVGQARGTRLSRRPGQRFEALAAVKKAAVIGRDLKQPPEWFDRLRNEAIAALALPDLLITKEFGRIPVGKAMVGLSEEFELYVQTTEKGACTVRRVADDSEVARLPEIGGLGNAGFGRGRTLAVLGLSGTFRLYDVSGGTAARRLEAKGVGDWRFHPNGRSLAVVNGEGGISVYAVTTGKLLHRLPTTKAGGALSLHPTEPLIASFWYGSGVVSVYDLQTGAVVASAPSRWPGGNGRGDWSPDGRTLLVPEAEGTRIHEYAFDSQPPALRPLRTFEGPYQGYPCLTFNPAGDRFVTRGWSGTVHLFDAGSGKLLLEAPGLRRWTDGLELQFDLTGQRLAAARVGDANGRFGVWSFAPGLEYRYLIATDGAQHVSGHAIHRGGRLTAIGRADGVALFDLETGREVAYVSFPGSRTFARFDGAGNLLTNNDNGFFRWPVRSDPANPGRLTVGPPERLPFNKGRYPVAASHDGRVIAQAMFKGYGMQAYAGGWILHPNSATPRQVDAGIGMSGTSVSPDGRWVAFVCHPEGNVNVYDAATGRRVWQSPTGSGGFCDFSPDGRWLLTGADAGGVYAVGTWEPGPQLGPGTPWDATSELAVLGQYRLVELASGRELARLEDPEHNGRAAFSPDGTRLVIEAKNGLRVWDLRRIREGLVEMGLDWAAPPYPKAKGTGKMPRLEVSVDQGDMAAYLVAERVADELRRKGDLAGALAAIQKAQAFAPADLSINHNLAYLLALCPDPKLRDARRAVELAKKAVGAEPNKWEHLRLLGQAHHFAGDDEAAVKALTRSLDLRQWGNAFDYFPLAAAHQKLGNKEEARKWYEQAVAWMAVNKTPYVAELAILRADAEALLGIEKEATPAPDKTSPDKRE
jgi:serine/threonine protein kinase/WD40 repeat protein